MISSRRYINYGLFVVLPLLYSFTLAKQDSYVGTYSAVSNHNTIELVVDANQTYSYTQKLCSGKDLQLSGVWTWKNKAIILLQNDKSIRFHKVWRFSKDGSVARSRSGMLFYTLRKAVD